MSNYGTKALIQMIQFDFSELVPQKDVIDNKTKDQGGNSNV